MIKLNWGVKACSIFLLWTATAVALPAQTFTTLQSLGDGYTFPSGLVQGTDGNFYGTAYGDGAPECDGRFGDGNCGVVFSITTGGSLTMLYGFSGGKDGEGPAAGLVQGADGKFYGTASGGGANTKGCAYGGCGTVFSITTGGTLTTLYSFCSRKNCPDGIYPSTRLVLGTNGSFYGTTVGGGANGDGTVFSITTGGKLTTLHSFDGMDGEGPSGLILGTNGKFYGTTSGGGANNDGTIFRLAPNGQLTTLHSFNETDGEFPSAGLVQGTNGNFYGTTTNGGANGDSCQYGGCGTVFQITSSGVLTTLYNFCSQGGSNCTDGEDPSGLVRGSDGNFYGTTGAGGTSCGDCGTAFGITTGGTLTTLYNFCSQSNCMDGGVPETGLVQGTDGNLYGTTSLGGGIYGKGTVFSLSIGLGPFVETNPTFGKVGANVAILGTGLTGTTSVTFNGAPATFTVVSASEITTTVPTGATTGTIQVVTLGGTLTSNILFTVLP